MMMMMVDKIGDQYHLDVTSMIEGVLHVEDRFYIDRG